MENYRKAQVEKLMEFKRQRDNPDDVPDCAATAAEYAEEMGMSVSEVNTLLDEAVEAGVMQTGRKRIKSGHLTWHWWAKEE